MASLAFVAAGLISIPGFTAGIIVEYIRQAEDVYRHLLQLLPPEWHDAVAVWTTAHDIHTEDRTAEELGVVPARRFARSALDTARIAIGTHRRFLQAAERDRVDGLTHYRGQRRSIIYLDETPLLVKLVEMSPNQVYAFRDAVKQTEEDHPWVQALHQIGRRMDDAYMAVRWDGATFVSIELVDDELNIDDLDHECASSLERFVPAGTPGRHTKAEAFEDVVRFIRAARDGYAFLYAQEPARFVAYQLSFRPFPGLVILDATSDLTGIRQLAPGLERIEAPRVDYRHLRLFHVPTPSEARGRTKEVMSKASTRRVYAAWLRKTVVDNTTEGELVLIVVHKALVDNEDIPLANDPDKPWSLAGRRVLVMTWGACIGANWGRDAEAVFLFGEFYIPKAAIVGMVLGLRDQPFKSASDISHAVAGKMKGDYGRAFEDHLCRWSAQLGARGCMRVIDGYGVAKAMRLYSTMPLDRLLRLRSEVWLGAPPPVVLGDGREARTKIEALANLLATTNLDVLWYRDLAVELETDPKNLQRLLNHRRVVEVAEAYSWSEVTRKAFGLAGKGKGLARLRMKLVAYLGLVWRKPSRTQKSIPASLRSFVFANIPSAELKGGLKPT